MRLRLVLQSVVCQCRLSLVVCRMLFVAYDLLFYNSVIDRSRKIETNVKNIETLNIYSNLLLIWTQIMIAGQCDSTCLTTTIDLINFIILKRIKTMIETYIIQVIKLE